jgi:hypothetical protein
LSRIEPVAGPDVQRLAAGAELPLQRAAVAVAIATTAVAVAVLGLGP